jgi:hypothetical protein
VTGVGCGFVDSSGFDDGPVAGFAERIFGEVADCCLFVALESFGALGGVVFDRGLEWLVADFGQGVSGTSDNCSFAKAFATASAAALFAIVSALGVFNGLIARSCSRAICRAETERGITCVEAFLAGVFLLKLLSHSDSDTTPCFEINNSCNAFRSLRLAFFLCVLVKDRICAAVSEPLAGPVASPSVPSEN